MAIFTNVATLTYNGNTTTSNLVTGELVETLSATKTAVRSTYAGGDSVTYVLVLRNTGAAAFTGLSVADDLGGYTFEGQTVYPLAYRSGTVLYYLNGTLQPSPTVTEGPPLAFENITVPAGGTATIVYEAALTGAAPLDIEGEITNTATINGGGLTAPITAEATVTAQADAALTVSKALCPPTVSENGQLTYTFVIQNTGNRPTNAGDTVTLTDTFDPILDSITVTFNGELWAQPANYTYNQQTGVFATVPGAITVPAATFTQNPDGTFAVAPGVATLQITGTV